MESRFTPGSDVTLVSSVVYYSLQLFFEILFVTIEIHVHVNRIEQRPFHCSWTPGSGDTSTSTTTIKQRTLQQSIKQSKRGIFGLKRKKKFLKKILSKISNNLTKLQASLPTKAPVIVFSIITKVKRKITTKNLFDVSTALYSTALL